MMSDKYKHWDYWASSIAAWGMAYVLTFEIMSVVGRGASCITFQEIGIFMLSFVVMFAATGWNVHVVCDKYPECKRVS